MLNSPVLTLNTGMIPIDICNVRDAITLQVLKKAEAVKVDSTRLIRSQYLSYPLPRVIMLFNYHKIPRKRVVHSRLNIIRACEQSLTRLRTDYIDLYQLHRPSPEIPFDEILRALDDLVRAGKVRYIGCSTHPAWMVAEAVMTSELKGYVRFVSEEPPYNLLDRRIENELVPMAQKLGLGLITWAPMAMGVLAPPFELT